MVFSSVTNRIFLMRYWNVLLFVFSLFLCKSDAQLHFASLGNWGSGSSAQYACGKTLSVFCEKQPIKHIISPGSNFIGGIDGLNDTKWNTSFTQAYLHSNLKVPFLTVLGLEDWNKNYTAEIVYTNMTYHTDSIEESKKATAPVWTMPNAWYHRLDHFRDTTKTGVNFGSSRASVIYVMIDTYILSENFPQQNITELHWNDLRETLTIAGSVVDWVIVVGDKPILSSGASKGDAYLSQTLRQLLKSTNVDAYISGGDFNMELIEDGSLIHINCGTGSSSDHIPRTAMPNSVFYDNKVGFCFHTLTKTDFTTQFVDGHTADILFEYKKRLNNRPMSYLDRFNKYHKLPMNLYIPIQLGPTLVMNEKDIFLRICGTIGLIVAFYLVALLSVVFGSRAFKAIK
ncbi:uncharacterized protein LOC128882989 [Hylaeus volcanicus]|uniref:uncharacterized protein LOC128882989 n=1 Tax=Hylaeus volcanicus TaxID=313075 RepID=UPI0023B7A455|nr:uncharacterized protein LOC128882989 [Hylaeus volcanicus]